MKKYSHAFEWKNVISNQMFIFQTKKEEISPFYSSVFIVVWLIKSQWKKKSKR